MTTSKRLRQSMLIHDKSFATSTSAFIETPTISSSQTTENHSNRLNQKESSQVNQRIDGFHHRTSKFIPDQFEIMTNNKHTNAHLTKTIVDERQSTCEDDWVCPVAVALRRAGYNVPLRPSKSWLERDRKKQALLREQQTSSKEM